MIFSDPQRFRRQLEWQWRFTRIFGLVLWPIGIAIVTAIMVIRGDPGSSQTTGEMIGMGAIMIGGGFLIVAGTWWLKAVFEMLIAITDRKK